MIRRFVRAIMPLAAAALVGTGSVAPTSAQEDAPIYLPAPDGTTLVVARGNGETAGRSDQQAYAFQFVAGEEPERFPVVAARGGTVMSYRSNVGGGRCREPLAGPRPSCWRDVNYVLIDHGDGTSALYLHLKSGQPLVRGQVVSAGQRIGTAGGSGWTDGVGLGFQVQRTPAWNEVGRGGWFLTESLPVSFADPDVLAQHEDGVPQTGDSVVSGNPGAAFEPFRFLPRPTGLPASVPVEPGVEVHVASAYDADAPEGYGVRLAAPVEAITDSLDPGFIPGPAVRPLFGGILAYAGCATGRSAALGRTVAIELVVEGTSYLAVHGGLSWIEPGLLEPDSTGAPRVVAPDEVIGHYGAIEPLPEDQTLECQVVEPDSAAEPDATIEPDAEPAAGLFVAIMRDGAVSPEGEITGGTPVSPEPLVGELAYEGLRWWAGPLEADEVLAEPGRPRARWLRQTAAHRSRIPFGDSIRLVARVRDVSDIAQVRFRAWYPRWPQVAASSGLASFDPDRTWSQLVSCPAPRAGQTVARGPCTWDGDANDARVTFVWDPRTAPPQPSAPWLPRAQRAVTRASTTCVPVSLAVEIVDRAGHVYSEIGRLPLPATCGGSPDGAAGRARVLYLEPFVPPRAPAPPGRVRDRGWPPVYAPDPLEGAIVWRDRSSNEDGFRVYARRSWLEVDCSVTNGPWRRVATLPPDTQRYRPNHKQVRRSIPAPEIEGVPGFLDRWEYAVSAFNEAGETPRVKVGGFVGGSEAFCDPGLVPPPELEP